MRTALLLGLSAVLGGCGGDANTTPVVAGAAGSLGVAGSSASGGAAGVGGSAAGAAGKGAAGGAAAGGAGGSSAGGSSKGGSSAGGAGAGGSGTGGASTGGAGAVGGGSGTGGNGGGAGNGGSAGTSGAPTCLDVPGLTINSTFPFCATRAHDTKSDVATVGPTWGRHGGPMTSEVGGSLVVIRRWTLPPDPIGMITQTAIPVSPTGLPAGAALGHAIDMPFLNWTLMAYGSQPPYFAGELIAITMSGKVASRAYVSGVGSWGAPLGLLGAPRFLGLVDGSTKQVLYGGISPLSATPTGDGLDVIYRSDICGGQLLPTGTCQPTTPVASWNTIDGARLAKDALGNVFGITKFPDGPQDVRGYVSGSLSGSKVADGQLLFTDGNDTFTMAAVAPLGASDGYLVLGSVDAGNNIVIYGVGYRVQGGAIVTTTAPAPLFSVANALPALFSDDTGGLWLGLDTGSFVQLQRK